jgi:hypothetical protein
VTSGGSRESEDTPVLTRVPKQSEAKRKLPKGGSERMSDGNLVTYERITELIEQLTTMLAGNDPESEEECWKSFGVEPESAIHFFESLRVMVEDGSWELSTTISFAFSVGIMIGRDQ